MPDFMKRVGDLHTKIDDLLLGDAVSFNGMVKIVEIQGLLGQLYRERKAYQRYQEQRKKQRRK